MGVGDSALQWEQLGQPINPTGPNTLTQFDNVVPRSGWLAAVSLFAGQKCPHGRTYARIVLLNPSKGDIAPLWAGYVAQASSVASLPGIYLSAGQVIRLELTTGSGGASTDSYNLFVAWSDTELNPGWLFNEPPFTGQGELRTVTPANPGVGTQLTYTVPALVRQSVRSFACQYAVANSGVARSIAIQFQDSAANVLWTIPSAYFGTAAINATATVLVSQTGASLPALATPLVVPLGDALLYAAEKIVTNFTVLAGADQISAVVIYVEEWAGFEP